MTVAARETEDTVSAGVWADRNAGRFDSALGSPAYGHALAGTGEGAAGLPTLASPFTLGRMRRHLDLLTLWFTLHPPGGTGTGGSSDYLVAAMPKDNLAAKLPGDAR